jgi:NADH-quinone oxidoreductase subunit N
MMATPFGIPGNWLAVAVFTIGALILLGFANLLSTRGRGVQIAGAATALLAALTAGLGPVAAPAVWAIAGVCLLAALLLPTLELHDRSQLPEAGALLLLASAGAVALATGDDLLQMALGLETLALAAAVMVGMSHGQRPLEAAFKYFVLGAVSFAAILYGIGLVYVASGSLALPRLDLVDPAMRPVAVAGLLLVVAGFAFELAAVPLHWAPLDAYTAASPGVAGFVMSASKVAAASALARLAFGAGVPLSVVLAAVGLVTIAWGTLGALAQRDMRRLLGYSAVAHGGFLALALSAGPLGGQAAVFYAVIYAAMALVTFASLAGRGTDALTMEQLRAEPLGATQALGLGLGLFSLAGIPPTPGFWAKLAVLVAVWHGLGPIPALIAAAFGVAGALYYLRPVPDLLASLRAAPVPRPGTSPAVALAVLAVVILGLAPGMVWVMAGVVAGG